MGNDQSSMNEKREREYRTQAAIGRALENQRRIYEERCRQLLLQTQSPRQENTSTTSGRIDEVATDCYNNNNTIDRQSLYPNLSQATAVPHTSSSVINYPAHDVMNNVHVATNIASCSTNTHSQLHDDMSRITPSAPPEPTTERRPPPIRSQSKKIKEGGKELNCPMCHNKFGLNIYQCDSGHSSCRECKSTGRRCAIPNCGKIITDMRNRTLEAYIADIMLAEQALQTTTANKNPQPNVSNYPHKINCPNQRDGCGLRFNANEMDNHLKECPFNEMACPLAAIFGRCSWRGKINQVTSHFTEFHPEHLQAKVDTEMTLVNIKNDQRIVHLVTIGAFTFLVHVKVDTTAQVIYMAAQLLGTNMSAAKWSYEFHIYNKAQPRRKYQYLDVCQSNSTSIDDIFNNNKCVVIPFVYAMTFKNNDSFTFKFFLKKQLGNKNIATTSKAS